MNRKKTILVVDDSLTVREFINRQLRQEGYDVILSRNGRDAIKAASLKPPDLIVLDIMMPDIDGYEVLRQLRKIDSTKDIPIIFLSGETQEENIKKAIDFGINDYLVKPYVPLELLRRIQRLLNQEQAC